MKRSDSAELRITLLVLAVAGGLLGCHRLAGGPPADHPETILDHFLCYEAVDPEPAPAAIDLHDQFDAEGYRRPAQVTRVLAFCNPAAKRYKDRESKIRNEDHHLVGYLVETKGEGEPVAIDNQITGYKKVDVKLDRPLWLFAPAQKLSPKEHGKPQGLDHFLCYRPMDPKRIDEPVAVKDQFTREYKDAKIGPLRAICNPVDKRHDGKEFHPEHPNAHLACYELKLDFQPPNVRYRDQFHPELGGLMLRRPWALCVPSNKEKKPQP